MNGLTVFEVLGQSFALDTESVVEAVKVQRVFPVPGSGEELEGVINLRNNVIPIYNSGILLKGEKTLGETVLIISVGGENLGILVDRIKGIEKLQDGKLKKALKKKIGDLRREFIKGYFEKDGKPVFVLKIESLVKKGRKKQSRGASRRRFSTEDQKAVDRQSQERKRGLLIFRLGEEWFAFPVENVNEVIEAPESLSYLPDSPSYVKGVFIFRDRQMTLVSLHRLIGVGDDSNARRAIVPALGKSDVCVAVDDVTEIRWVGEESILKKEDSRGFVALDEGRRIVMILDIAEVLGFEDEVYEDGGIEQASERGEEKMRSFVGFEIGDAELAVPIEKVKEVVEVSEVTALPESPDYIEGVYNLRNSVILIVSLSQKIGVNGGEESNKVIVLDDLPVGLKVTRLKGIIRAEEDSIQDVRSIRGIEREVFEGVIKSEDGKVVFILDPEALLSKSDLDTERIGELVKLGEGHEEGR